MAWKARRGRPEKTPAQGVQQAAHERSGPLPTPASKRRPAAIGIAVALAVVGGLLAWAAAQSSGASPYLVVGQHIQRGEQIQQGMLTTIGVVGEPEQLVPAEAAAELIGQVATMDLAPGTAVTRQNTASTLGVPQGQAILGLALEAGRLPARQLSAGDVVLVVHTPPPGQNPAPGQGGEDPVIRTATGTVEATTVDEVSGRTVVDVQIRAADSAQVASWAAAGSVSIALQAAEGQQ